MAIFGIVAGLFWCAAPAVSQAQSTIDEVKQRGELRIAGVLYRPLISPRPSGEYVGIDVEMMKLMAADLGVKPTSSIPNGRPPLPASKRRNGTSFRPFASPTSARKSSTSAKVTLRSAPR
jgi:ABC-type amino acid transport substrate-binding protein